MKVVALAGGTGSAKLLRGLDSLGVDLTVVANVGDNIWMYGVYVCPDIDVACYSLAGIADRAKGWGVAGDTFEMLKALRRLGLDTWFKLGDQDFATCLVRTRTIHSGGTLTEATEMERRALGVTCKVLPVTDNPVETRILTPRGDEHLQEFWVRDKGRPEAIGVRYRGASKARVSVAVKSALAEADRVVVCPANPVTSIGPMLAVPGFTRMLSKTHVAALSPMEGEAPFSGPAGKLMKAIGSKQNSAGVAGLYAGFLGAVLISERDRELEGTIEAMGIRCIRTDTRISTANDATRLAKELLET